MYIVSQKESLWDVYGSLQQIIVYCRRKGNVFNTKL